MCALFGPRVDVHALELELDAHIWPLPLAIEPGVHAAPPLATTVRVGRLGETVATIRPLALTSPSVESHTHHEGLLAATAGEPVSLGLSVLGRALPLPPLTASSQTLSGLTLEGQAHDLTLSPRVRVRRDVAAARDRLVERRSVPARSLTEAQSAYWRKRMGDAKRVSPKLVDLIALFPDVPIVGDQPVQYAHGILSYRLPESPVPLSTVVIAKHLHTGEVLLGRFARP